MGPTELLKRKNWEREFLQYNGYLFQILKALFQEVRTMEICFIDERFALEGEIVRKCLARNEQQCSFVELAILEFIHLLVETMDRHFGNVCELDIMFSLEKSSLYAEGDGYEWVYR
ncbi:hypothetical protein Leryth_021838 [Lithospermum erythrorhizon]|nr:hypothetical protein Leryth_021838 [Lithospermum erythrorhizon]